MDNYKLAIQDFIEPDYGSYKDHFLVVRQF